MQLDITGHQIDLTEALQHHVREKMNKLQRHSDEITHTHVVLNVEKHTHHHRDQRKESGPNRGEGRTPVEGTQENVAPEGSEVVLHNRVKTPDKKLG